MGKKKSKKKTVKVRSAVKIETAKKPKKKAATKPVEPKPAKPKATTEPAAPIEIRDRIKEFKRIRAADLVPDPDNWRTHPRSQKDAVAGILREIGYADAMLARETPEGVMLIDGHLRRELTPNQNVPVLILDVTEAEAKKILTTLDPLAAMAGADKDSLKHLMDNIETDSEGLQKMLDNLAVETGIAPPPEQADDGPDPCFQQIEELLRKWEVCDGQRWQIVSEDGARIHYLLCGDSTKEADVNALLDGERPFLMVTDPPYGVEYDPEWRKNAGINNSNRMGTVSNDERYEWTDTYRLFPGAVAYVWHGGKFAGSVGDNLMAAGFEIRTQIVWRKTSLVISRGHYHWQHEPCWYAVKKGRTAKWSGDRKQSTIWDIETKRKTEDSETVHSTQKPAECMARPIRNHGGPNDLVYDPFLGSGTTILAAEQCGRICYGMELDPGYVAVILERCEGFGMKPKLCEFAPKPAVG